jgi:hypothetical protein
MPSPVFDRVTELKLIAACRAPGGRLTLTDSWMALGAVMSAGWFASRSGVATNQAFPGCCGVPCVKRKLTVELDARSKNMRRSEWQMPLTI